MTHCPASSLQQSLGALPQSALVIDGEGNIQFANSRLKAYSEEHGITPVQGWTGANCFEWLREPLANSNYLFTLYASLQSLFRGERLVFSTELSIRTTRKGIRRLRLDSFPLISDPLSPARSLVVSLWDAGPLKDRPFSLPHRPLPYPDMPLVPICASCKSIRSAKEEWIRIEHFLKHKLSMQFTHDICPDCIRTLYPRYAGPFKESGGKE